MELIIRKARSEDANSLAEIHCRSWEEAYRGIIPENEIKQKNATRAEMWAKTLSGEHDNYIALRESMPVGFMGIPPARDSDLKGAGEISAIYLHPAFWGMGFGKTMIEFGLKTLSEAGYSTVSLWIFEENARARAFYHKNGFAPDGAQKDLVYGKTIRSLRYVRDIAALRPLEKSGCEQAASLIRDAFADVALEFGLTPENCAGNPAFQTPENLELLLSQGGRAWNLFFGREIAGFAALRPDADGFELMRLCVLPRHRHRGIGAYAVRTLSDVARKDGAKKLYIGLIDKNARLKSWYIGFGFVETGMTKYPHLPFDVCHMEKSL